MALFITYARPDSDTVTGLRADIEALGWSVWIDERLTGGQDWWDEILAHIRDAEFYIFTLSKHSLRSQACDRELDYAVATRRSILMVRLDDTPNEAAPPKIRRIQSIDFSQRTPEALIGLARALSRGAVSQEFTGHAAPPPLPESYATRFAARLLAADISAREQAEILASLKLDVASEEHQQDALKWLRIMRDRQDVTWAVAEEINTLLSTHAKSNTTDRPARERSTAQAVNAGQVIERSHHRVAVPCPIGGTNVVVTISVNSFVDTIAIDGNVQCRLVGSGLRASDYARLKWWLARKLIVQGHELKVAYEFTISNRLRSWYIHVDGVLIDGEGSGLPSDLRYRDC